MPRKPTYEMFKRRKPYKGRKMPLIYMGTYPAKRWQWLLQLQRRLVETEKYAEVIIREISVTDEHVMTYDNP